jgi:hypothetical protein
VIPPPPDEARPALWTRAPDAVVATFPGFPALTTSPLTRAVDLTLESVDVLLAQGQVQISLSVAIDERDGDLRDLFCTVSSIDEPLQAAFEGSSVWLQIGDEGPAMLEKALNELGDVTFSRLSPGRYALRLLLAGREYVVMDIVLP